MGGQSDGEMLPFKGGFGVLDDHGHMHRPIIDTIASLIGHGLCSRFPDLRIARSRTGATGCASSSGTWRTPTTTSPHEFDEDPVEVFKRNIYVHPFHEEDPMGLVELLGADRVLFGSDYPHPEGMSDPISFVDELQGLDKGAIRKVMGGNLAGLMHISDAA